ncbi:probable palmitoyltransferase ZDHHC24 [Diabrotica virgifera virgifera]|uniref:Palmitoyltransferase n=2 Tax=Diabrotica virgifera virgifera TaxID=50390 RepID=A0A6P7G5Q5_DIAVI|nr:probable palmitoyltransferase ZDHHC24 [Diabrotica virgifera virgifera]
MRLRQNIFPKCVRDFFVTGFLLVMIPVVYYFELFVVLPRYYIQWSASYNFHFLTGTIILFNICTNLVAIAMCDTSIRGRVLPTDLKPDWKFCSVCESLAPPRSWHCSVCNVCILKRDHHCMFTSYCVGLENHRYFMVFLLYMLIATLYASFYNMRFISHFITFDFSWKSIFKIVFPLATLFMDWTQNQLFIFLILIVLFGAGFSGALLYFHVDLMFRSVVTHERNTVSKYDRGRLENVKLVLGEKWYLVWLSPWIESKLPCDGINWDKILSTKEK